MNITDLAKIALMMVLVACTGSLRADCDWQMLGQRSVDHRADHDEIPVEYSEGTFNSVQLRVQGAPVEFSKVTVYFRNGGKQELDIRDEIPAGGETRTIDLQGRSDDRHIERVAFNYRTAESGDGRAVVQLWAKT